MTPAQFLAWTKSCGITLSEDRFQLFQVFHAALYEANKTANFTRVAPDEGWLRHFVDSLLFHDVFPEGASVLDVGAGPGLPSWPLACARPDLQLTALDSNLKMLRFLRTMPLPNLRIVEGRAEDFAEIEQFDRVTGRALAPLPIQLELSVRPCRLGGAVTPMRTPQDELNQPVLKQLGLELQAVWRRNLPETEIVRVMPVFLKIAPTSKRIPRRWSEIKTRPLR